MSKELLGALALSALVTLGIVKWKSDDGKPTADDKGQSEQWIEPEDELDNELQNLTYPQFLRKYDLPDNDDSITKYRFIKKPDASVSGSVSVEKAMRLDYTKIKKLKDSDKYEELSDYLDEKIREMIDDPSLRHIKLSDLKKLKSELLNE